MKAAPEEEFHYSATYSDSESEEMKGALTYFEARGFETMTRTDEQGIHIYYRKKRPRQTVLV